MDFMDCQKQIERVANKIRVLETHAQKAQIRGIPFVEDTRLEFLEFLREQIEKKCKSIRHS